jgi:hypothetical protein
MGRVLFVAHQYVPDAIPLFVKFVIYKQDRPTGITEHGIHTLFD